MRWSRNRHLFAAQTPYLTIGLMLSAGFVLVIFEYWRRGLVTVGVATILAGVLRLLLPARRVGLLSVRGRSFDVAAYLFLGVAVIAIGLAIPAPVG